MTIEKLMMRKNENIISDAGKKVKVYFFFPVATLSLSLSLSLFYLMENPIPHIPTKVWESFSK
jgi:hypothetical protein